MTIWQAEAHREYIIVDIKTKDAELNAFLFSLGFYWGEKIELISKQGATCIVYVKNTRYSVDKALAEAIEVFI